MTGPRWGTAVPLMAPLFESPACEGVDPDLFFPDKSNGQGYEKPKAVCARCTCQTVCLEYAIAARPAGYPVAGVWGGTSANERAKIRRDRGLGPGGRS